jgi:SAM-dependent methyltransferase
LLDRVCGRRCPSGTPRGYALDRMQWMDWVVEGVGERLSRSRFPTPGLGLLGEARMHAALRALEQHRERALELARAMDRGEDGAAEAYGAFVERVLGEMRDDVRRSARGAPEQLAAALDARWHDAALTEYLDDPAFDEAARVKLLAQLDAFNRTLGTYRAFFRAMTPLLSRDRTTRVLDLASGHAGYALEMVRIANRRGYAIEVTATDLKPEYLELGREISEREGLGVRFARQDALDLSNIEVGEHDVIVCTQSIHHFAASMIARMFRESARVAGRGVVLIDGCRSALQGGFVGAVTWARYLDKNFTHDAWVSFRRFYAPEELGLITKLGPEADGVVAKWMRPAHCLVRWTRS